MNKVTSALHDATHQVPGVPEHHENRPNPNAHHEHAQAKKPERHQAPARHQNSPRVLVAWQNWIARRVGKKSS